MDVKQLDKNKTYLITGVAGFIGFHLAQRLLQQECKVIGIDNLNDYYNVDLKNSRLNIIKPYDKFTFFKDDITNKEMLIKIFNDYKPDIVINLAAQAGVRYSIENPDVYIQSNIIGFFNILEACRFHPVSHLIYASSSSVYGANKKVPFEETDFVDHPVSLYAATKKSNELMAYTYSHLFRIPTTGLRFFTVYGPMGRPDMAYFDFVNKYFRGEPIKIYNNGDFDHDLCRDFTYIDDIVEGIINLLSKSSVDEVPYKLYNIGNSSPVKLMHFIETLEKSLSSAIGRKVVFNKKFEAMKKGDVPVTYASIEQMHKAVNFKPHTNIEKGLQAFADWYVKYYKIK